MGSSSRKVKGIVAAAVLLGLVAAGYFFTPLIVEQYAHEATFAPDTVRRSEHEVTTPIMMYGMAVNDLHVVEDVVKRNQRFTDLIAGYYVKPSTMQQLSLLPRATFDFRRIATRAKYVLIAEQDSVHTLRTLVYEFNPVDYVVFHFGDSLRVEEGHREVVTVHRQVAGVIGSSLSETVETLGLSHTLTNKVVDIFAWQIDFQRLQKGDRFKLNYEELQVDGQQYAIGKIEGIYFEHFNHPYYAIPFDQGDGEDFFDDEGNSLRKALLKYPIEFTRISSRYNLNRFHPVAKVFRAHRGTDFAAPTGTPIRTVGDGIVLEATYNGNNGNYVKVRHNGTYTTQYLHMSRIASGIRSGVKVRQGETIGYVGSTGLATGPHLCYRFWRNGVQVDALKVELPPSQPVKDDWKGAFDEVKSRVIRNLDQILLPEPPVIATN